MNILVTGAKGMVGTALVANLKNIKENKNRTRPNLHIEDIYEYDRDSTAGDLESYCQKADFVFNLAGVNRPENPEDFMKGNFGFASELLDNLKKYNNKASIMLSSSIQATLADVLETANTAEARRREKNCSFIMPGKPGQRLQFTVSQT